MAGRLRAPLSPRDEARMTLIEHLEELRTRILKIAIAFILVAIAAWFFRARIYNWMLDPAPALEGDLSVTSVTEPFITDLKLALYAAFLLTIPILLYQAWMFVAPAVGDMGRAFTYTLVALASSLFLAGVAFGYYVVLPIGVQFLLTWAPERYELVITSENYLAFVSRFLLAFGIVFEFPAATYVGAKLGLVTAPFLKSYRKHAVLVNVVLAAVLTPGQDPFSMVLMAIPMVVMYEVSILIARYVNPVVPHEEAMEASPLSDRIPKEDRSDGRDEDEEDPVERDL